MKKKVKPKVVYERGERAVYIPEEKECKVLYQYAKRDYCIVRFPDGVEDIISSTLLRKILL